MHNKKISQSDCQRFVLIAYTALFIVACSPYLYKNEISGFDTGMGQLEAADSSGLQKLSTDQAQKNRWVWIANRPKLNPTSGCIIGVTGAPPSLAPCALHAAGQSVPAPLRATMEIVKAKVVFDVLRDYTTGLSAITNAADREAFDAAQAQLKKAIENAASVASKKDPAVSAQLGAIASLFADIGGWYLDNRRYQALKNGATAAQPTITVLGKAAGETLDALRFAQGEEVFQLINEINKNVGPKMDPSTYGSRVDLLQSNVATLEQLRTANPTQAARDMVEAHNKLVAALANKSRQLTSIFSEVKKFVDDASVVRKAFDTDPK